MGFQDSFLLLFSFSSWAVFAQSGLYEINGSIEVDTNENSLFYWSGHMYLLENVSKAGVGVLSDIISTPFSAPRSHATIHNMHRVGFLAMKTTPTHEFAISPQGGSF